MPSSSATPSGTPATPSRTSARISARIQKDGGDATPTKTTTTTPKIAKRRRTSTSSATSQADKDQQAFVKLRLLPSTKEQQESAAPLIKETIPEEKEVKTTVASVTESKVAAASVNKEVIGNKEKWSSAPPQNVPQPAKGRCKSGRFWKSDRDRFRSVIGSKGLKGNIVQRRKIKEDRQRAKALELSLKEDVKKGFEELRERQKENKRRREENERKAEIVQVVSS